MKNQKGFTLIELLLVLAIIGIISAIAIPALLAQRENARNKSSQSNGVNILSNFVTAVENAREAGEISTMGLSELQDATVGKGSDDSRVPAVWIANNPWLTAGAPAGYSIGKGGEDLEEEKDTSGKATLGKSDDKNRGQVQVGYLEPDADTGMPSVLFTAVTISKPLIKGDKDSVTILKSTGLD